MSGDIKAALSGQQANLTIESMKAVGKEEQLELQAEQLESKAAFLLQMEEMTNPFAARYQTRQKTLENRNSKVQKMLESADKEERLMPIQQIKDSADQFQRRNPELKAKILLLLRDQIKPDDSKEEIIRKVSEFYRDVSLADEALEFLLETTEGELNVRVQEVRADFNKTYEREILAGRNMGAIARETAEKGLGTPTTLRDMYRDITGNPRESTTLFSELSRLYAYNELKKVVNFLLHSLGADLKAKGPSISRALLQRLITEARSLQAILGVYNFFKGRMNLIGSLFVQNDLSVPEQLNFESLAKAFMSFVSDRYPSADKALQLATRLGIEKWLIAKIIVLSQLRDGIRQVAVNQVFKSIQHRDDSYMALIEALEDLEDELEELEEEDEEEEEEEEYDGEEKSEN